MKKCKNYMILIIDELDNNITLKNQKRLNAHLKKCSPCRKKREEIIHTQKIVLNQKIPYQKAQEEALIDQITFEQEVPVKQHIFSFRPALITVSIIVMIILGLISNHYIQQNRIRNEIKSIITLKTRVVDFVFVDNMDQIMQLYLQENNNSSFLDDDELSYEIKHSLSLYLNTKKSKEYINENREIINEVIDDLASDHLNYIKENYKNILI